MWKTNIWTQVALIPRGILTCSSFRENEMNQSVTQFNCTQGELMVNTFIFSSYFICVFRQQSVWSKFQSLTNNFLRNNSSKCSISRIFCNWVISASDGYKLLLQKKTELSSIRAYIQIGKISVQGEMTYKYFLLVSIQSFLLRITFECLFPWKKRTRFIPFMQKIPLFCISPMLPMIMSSTLYEGQVSFISQLRPTTDDLITSKRLESQFLSTEETFLNTRYLVLEHPGTLNHDETKKSKAKLGLPRFYKSGPDFAHNFFVTPRLTASGCPRMGQNDVRVLWPLKLLLKKAHADDQISSRWTHFRRANKILILILKKHQFIIFSYYFPING